jgi:hypothetical protein
MELNVYLSKDRWEAEGICRVKGRSNGTEFIDNATASVMWPKILNVYLDSDGNAYADNFTILLSDGTESEEFLLHNPPCSPSPVRKGKLTYRAEGDEAVFSFPRLGFSGFEKYVIRYGSGTIAFLSPANLGEITATVPRYTGEATEEIKVSLNGTLLTPGETVSVAFTLLGSGGELMYRSEIFETSVWTSAMVIGCGLYESDRFYEGGEGYSFDENRFIHENLRWLVEYRGSSYALKASDFTAYSIGERVAVVKNGLNGNALTTGKALSSSVREELYDNDIIVPFDFYHGA